jgi:hypothetical protein
MCMDHLHTLMAKLFFLVRGMNEGVENEGSRREHMSN